MGQLQAHSGSREKFIDELSKINQAGGCENPTACAKGTEQLPNVQIGGLTNDGKVEVIQTSLDGKAPPTVGTLSFGSDGMINVVPLNGAEKSENRPVFAHSDNRMEDIKPNAEQGALGDCYFLSTLDSLAKQDPELIARMVKDNHDGTSTVTFPSDPEHPVTVNNPTDWELRTFQAATSYGTWEAVVEKAHRKYSHEQLNDSGSQAEYAMSLLTGRPAALFSFVRNPDPDQPKSWTHSADNGPAPGDQYPQAVAVGPGLIPNKGEVAQNPKLADALAGDENQYTADKQHIAALLQEGLKSGYLVVAGTTTGTVFEDPRQKHDSGTVDVDGIPLAVGIEPTHAYTVLGYDEKSNTVLLRNPQGSNALDRNMGQRIRQPELRMPLDTFYKTFSNVAIGQTEK